MSITLKFPHWESVAQFVESLPLEERDSVLILTIELTPRGDYSVTLATENSDGTIEQAGCEKQQTISTTHPSDVNMYRVHAATDECMGIDFGNGCSCGIYAPK